MMDVGFGGVIEKFEQHYGSRAAKALLGLIALAIVAACVAIIWQWLVSPVLSFFNSPERIRLLIQLLYFGLGIGSGMVLARLAARKWTREGRELQERFDAALSKNRQSAQELKNAAEDLKRTIEESDTRLVAISKNTSPEDLRRLARQIEKQAVELEGKGEGEAGA